MSLINDALQRAKEVQQNQPADGARLQFRPVEAAPAQPGSRLMLPVLFAALLVAAGFVWIQFHPQSPAASAQPVRVVATRAPVARPAPVAPATASALPVLAKTLDPAISNDAPPFVAEPPRLRATPLRLQAIVFSTSRPSAIINGKTVYLNGRLGDLRVRAIGPASVTLVNGTTTNVLTLEE
jgi:hypothetical protein